MALNDGSRLGQLALDAGLLDRRALDSCLARASREGVPLGAAMLAEGTPARELGALLATQHDRRRPPRSVAPRLSVVENRRLGAWLVAHGLVDGPRLERARQMQAAAMRRGVHRLLGELLLDDEALVPIDALDELIAALGGDGPTTDDPHAALFDAPPPLPDAARAYAVRVDDSPDPRAVGRVYYPGDAPLLIGRGTARGIGLDDPRVSRAHADVRVVDGRLALADLGSENGTWVDGVAVATTHLDPGAGWRVGDTALRFVRGDEPSDAPIDAPIDAPADAPIGAPAELAVIELDAGDPSTAPRLDATRSIFRAFHQRREEAEATRAAATRAYSRRITLDTLDQAAGQQPVEVARPRRRALPVILLSGVLLAGVLTTGALERAVASWRPAPRDTRSDAQRLVTTPPPPPPVVVAPVKAGDRVLLVGRTLGWRWLRGDRGDQFAGVVDDVNGDRRLLVQGPASLLPDATADRPLGDGSLVQLRGVARALRGPAARLPGGGRTRIYVEVQQLELQH